MSHEKQLKDNANRARIEPLSRRAVPLIEDYDAVPMGDQYLPNLIAPMLSIAMSQSYAKS